MEKRDIRWLQRFENFKRALVGLEDFVNQDDLNVREKQGMIKAFEYTFELAWNTIKEYFEYQGEVDIRGSRDAIQLAFKRDLIEDGEGWMQMIVDRNRTSHIYNQEVADEIGGNILESYYGLFTALKERLDRIQ